MALNQRQLTPTAPKTPGDFYLKLRFRCREGIYITSPAVAFPSVHNERLPNIGTQAHVSTCVYITVTLFCYERNLNKMQVLKIKQKYKVTSSFQLYL